MGLVYENLHEKLPQKSTIHVGKYASPMDHHGSYGYEMPSRERVHISPFSLALLSR